jgi:hypothetical protein
LVVQATEDAHWNDPPDPVDRSMDWGVLRALIQALAAVFPSPRLV